MCRILSGKIAEDDRHTHWKHALKVHRDSPPPPKLRGWICHYETFCIRIFVRRTFSQFRYCSRHVKIHVLLTYSAVKHRAYVLTQVGTSGITHERQPNFRSSTPKKKMKQKNQAKPIYNFATALRAGEVIGKKVVYFSKKRCTEAYSGV